VTDIAQLRHDFAVIEVQISCQYGRKDAKTPIFSSSENDLQTQKNRLVSKGVDRFGGILGIYQKS
jgi:hypothetical protein